MNRNKFLITLSSFIAGSTSLKARPGINPEVHFFEDDGIVPNNKLPLLHYRKVFTERDINGAVWLERRFLSNNWSNSWRNGIFTFQHYHSIAHEVLGIYSGEALVLLGGDHGRKVFVNAGDIIVIPAGVGHKNLGDHNLGVVGAYPNGMPVDIMRCEPGERPRVDQNIAAVPLPDLDPFLGEIGGINKVWLQQ